MFVKGGRQVYCQKFLLTDNFKQHHQQHQQKGRHTTRCCWLLDRLYFFCAYNYSIFKLKHK